MRQFKTKIRLADAQVSRLVRDMAGQRCERCHRSSDQVQLTCSHFYGRRHESTRMDLENLASLCVGCHQYFEGEKNGDYLEWMIRRLGQRRFDALKVRAMSYGKKDDTMAKIRIAEIRRLWARGEFTLPWYQRVVR